MRVEKFSGCEHLRVLADATSYIASDDRSKPIIDIVNWLSEADVKLVGFDRDTRGVSDFVLYDVSDSVCTMTAEGFFSNSPLTVMSAEEMVVNCIYSPPLSPDELFVTSPLQNIMKNAWRFLGCAFTQMFVKLAAIYQK